jgi:hypothetical protein
MLIIINQSQINKLKFILYENSKNNYYRKINRSVIMEILNQLKEKIISAILYYYIDFVYKTSKIERCGNLEYLESEYPDKFVLFIWHGDSYCYYPFLKRKKLNIVTTQNKRGGVITRISNHFGYDVLRLLTVDVKYSISLKNRWDKLKIPLPFNKITINVKKALKIERKDRKEKFKSLKKEIKKSMEN